MVTKEECEWNGKVFVPGYRKQDGTWVMDHCRRKTFRDQIKENTKNRFKGMSSDEILDYFDPQGVMTADVFIPGKDVNKYYEYKNNGGSDNVIKWGYKHVPNFEKILVVWELDKWEEE